MQLTDTDLMPWGDHKGTPMQDVPARYLLQLWNHGIRDARVKAYVKDALTALEAECPDIIVEKRS